MDCVELDKEDEVKDFEEKGDAAGDDGYEEPDSLQNWRQRDTADAFGAVVSDWIEVAFGGEDGLLMEEHGRAPINGGSLGLETFEGKNYADNLENDDPEVEKDGCSEDADVHFEVLTFCAAIKTGF